MTSTGKTVGQIKDEHRVFLDAQPMTVRCRLPKCRWRYTGPAASARDQAEAHRAERHADLNPRSREQITKEAKMSAKPKVVLRPAPETRQFETAPKRVGREPRWSKEKIIDAIRTFATRNGRPPTSQEARSDHELPTPPVAKKYCGSWADAVEQAGFTRPKRGIRYARPTDLVLADAEEAERLADLAEIDKHIAKVSERLIETVLVSVRAEHEREAKRLAGILRRFAGGVLELVQSLEPKEK